MIKMCFFEKSNNSMIVNAFKQHIDYCLVYSFKVCSQHTN